MDQVPHHALIIASIELTWKLPFLGGGTKFLFEPQRSQWNGFAGST